MPGLGCEAGPAAIECLPAAGRWGVAHTRSRCEKRVAEFLGHRDVSYFLPLIRRRNVGNREIRYFSVPLFPAYVFFDTSAIECRSLFSSRKVARVIEAEDQETLRQELSNLARALAVDARLCEARWGEVGRPVRVVRGSLRGLTGEVVRLDGGARLLIRVSFIARAACLEIDESLVEPR